jgi:hypothetical protein
MTMRLNDHGGLACTESGWALATLLVVAWLAAPAIALIRRGGWRALPTSLLGFVWLGFGVDFVIRFGLLALDSVEFGNDTFRLADLDGATVEQALGLVLLYWGCFVLGFGAWGALHTPGPLSAIVTLGGEGRSFRRNAVLVVSTAFSVLASGMFPLPLALLTPMGIAGTLWVIPAAYVWAAWSANPSDAALTRLRWLVLAPALVRFAASPFREHVLPLALIPLLAWRCTHGRLERRHRLALAAVLPAFLLVGNAVQTYRDFLWGGPEAAEVVEERAMKQSDEFVEPDPDWLISVRRFHGLDSVLLTVDLVPTVFPFRDEPVLTDALVRGFVPRLFMPNKELSDRGQEFARTIWAYDSGIESSAAIAPSMPGDLYHAGGTVTVALGALVWGLLLGLVDRWKDALAPGGRVAVLVLLATQAAPSVERDFVHCVATMLQSLVVITVIGAGLAQFWRPRSARGVAVPLEAVA